MKDHGLPASAGATVVLAKLSAGTLGRNRRGGLLHDRSLDISGLVTHYTLFVHDLRSERVHAAGSTPNPDATFMTQAARRLTDAVDRFLAGHRVLLCDRDGK